MNYLILIKHSLPEINPAIPAPHWQLSEEGRSLCRPLAEKLAYYQPGYLAASTEPKATETAQLVGQSLGLPVEIVADLHEHDRTNALFYPTKAEFEQTVFNFFAKPQELIFGQETAAQAYNRFAKAIDDIIKQQSRHNIAIVAHGTVISLFVAGCTGVAPFLLWQQLGLPSMVVLSLPQLQLVQVIGQIL